MENNNETVENLSDELKSLGVRLRLRAVLTAEEIYNISNILETKPEIILAAHKREIAAKDEEIDCGRREYIRCREELRATRERRDDCEVKMHKALERVARTKDALAAKDAEIESLSALVKELTEKLDLFTCRAEKCNSWCGDNERSECLHLKNRKLIAKAKEVVK